MAKAARSAGKASKKTSARKATATSRRATNTRRPGAGGRTAPAKRSKGTRATAASRGANRGRANRANGANGANGAREANVARGSRNGARRDSRDSRDGRDTGDGTTVEGMLGGLPMRSVTGQLVVDGAADAIDWYVRVFGAKELDRKPMPDGRIMHAVLQIGDTGFMISDPFAPGTAPQELSGAYLHIQDRNIQQMWDRALANGATSLLPLANQFWGDKYGQLRDPFGQMWSFGWPAKMTEAQKARMQKEAMAQMA